MSAQHEGSEGSQMLHEFRVGLVAAFLGGLPEKTLCVLGYRPTCLKRDIESNLVVIFICVDNKFSLCSLVNILHNYSSMYWVMVIVHGGV